jgi:hypothetical protein
MKLTAIKKAIINASKTVCWFRPFADFKAMHRQIDQLI